MSNTVSLEFAGDAKSVVSAARKASDATEGVGESATEASKHFDKASKESASFTDRIGKLGAGVSGISDAFNNAGEAVGALSDLQQQGKERAMQLARAQADVEQAQLDGKQAANDLRQAQLDLNQAQRDGRQASIDVETAQNDLNRANFDAETAQKALTDAIKQHGEGSAEAKSAALDLADAQTAVKQATEDSKQAQEDAKQANQDAKQATLDAAQATRDGKNAQLDLNEAMSAANPTGLQKFSSTLTLITPILSGLTGIIGLVTAAQWAWNIAMDANPIGLIIAGVAALVAVIVLIATKTHWFQNIWKATWSAVKWAVSSWWDYMKRIPGWIGTAFKNIAAIISWPFRTAFNFISDAWNATIGKLHWHFPGIFGAGAFDIAAPTLPRFHSGVTVPGGPQSEMLAILQGGETVTPRSSAGNAVRLEIWSSPSEVDQLLSTLLDRAIRNRGALGLGASRG